MKKRIVSMLLAVALAVTGIPAGIPVGITADGVYAAEISERESFAETESTIENKDAHDGESRPDTGAPYAFRVSEDGKAVGSDGIAYDDVAYLSADTVKAFGAEAQSAYGGICDRIAEGINAGGYVENVVIAVDGQENLIVQQEIPIKLLQTFMGELAENAFNDEAKDDAEEVTESFNEEDLHNEYLEDSEDSEEKNGNSETLATEAEEAMTENASAQDDEFPAEEVLDDIAAEDNAAEAETPDAAKEAVLPSENMELIYELKAEEFEVIDNAKADLIIDLGYDKTGDVQQFYSLLPQDSYFYDQLTDIQKTIFNASKVLGKGTTSFTISPPVKPSELDITRAVSAYMLTEPYKCDWWDTTGRCTTTDWYVTSTGQYEHTTLFFPKSEYYTSQVQKDANAMVLELAAQAQEYAAREYPDTPVYGIVKYYDNWICENHYYEKKYGILTQKDYVKDTDGRLVIKLSEEKAKPYYYSHSSYGVLLEDYGVCESYALAMTRLLDAVGIPNIYATGDALNEYGGPAGGHAWNYIRMPDGKWYLQDSTWNERDIDTPGTVSTPSTEQYLLCADDTNKPGGRIPDGNRWSGSKAFTFETRSPLEYKLVKNDIPVKEEIILSQKEGETLRPIEDGELNLLTKQTTVLTYDNKLNEYIMNENIPKIWASSNPNVAKADKNGKVTTVEAGSAEITLTAAGMTAKCRVNVHQIDSITFKESEKASLTVSHGIKQGVDEVRRISLTVKQKSENPVYTAQQLVQKGILEDVAAKTDASGRNIADIVSAELTGNEIELAIKPKKTGKAKIVIAFAGRKATLNYSAGEKLEEEWFDFREAEKLEEESKSGMLMYTGKAYKPKIVLSDEGKNRNVKFKVSYLGNKDAGTASVIITGTGAYSGEIRRTFEIQPLVLNVDTASLKIAASNLYNGGVNQAKSTVRHVSGTKKTVLKAGRDYEILYTNQDTKETTNAPSKAGTYSMEIAGIGNYAGTFPIEGKTWTIKKNDIKRVKVSVRVNGTIPDVTAAIGRNQLPQTDYKITYYTDKNCKNETNVSALMGKTQYFIKAEPAETGSNIEIGIRSKPIIKSFRTK